MRIDSNGLAEMKKLKKKKKEEEKMDERSLKNNPFF